MDELILDLYRESIYALYIEEEPAVSQLTKRIQQNTETLYPRLDINQMGLLDELLGAAYERALRVSVLGFIQGLRIGQYL